MLTKTTGRKRIKMQCSISPVEGLTYNVGSLLGTFNLELINTYYPQNVGKKINVIISELINNVVEHSEGAYEGFDLKINLDDDALVVKVKNRVSFDQFRKVKNHLTMIRNTENKKLLLANTMKKRRARGQKGGIGLIRLAMETGSVLSCRYQNTIETMTVSSRINLGDGA